MNLFKPNSDLALLPRTDGFSTRNEGSQKIPNTSPICNAAGRRLLALAGDPFLHVTWKQLVFFHFVIPTGVLQNVVPKPFELELHEGMGYVSLVALTMRNFRSCRACSPGRVFELIPEQRFLNLRTYVTNKDEPGALFLFGWLSQPLGLRLPSGMFGLPFSFATVSYDHSGEQVRGSVKVQTGKFAYRGKTEADRTFEPCAPGSFAEFAMERYSGFFNRGERGHVFRVWHPPWMQVPLSAEIEDASLITQRFPWFEQARLIGASLTATIEDVWVGNAHRLPPASHGDGGNHRVLSAFYDMP